jgi:type IV secretion system protein VirB1
MAGVPLIATALLACAPNVAPATIEAIVSVESGGNPIALNINGFGHSIHPRAPAEAVALARQYITAGYSVDLGLMQINSRNLASLGYTIEDALDPCRNVAGGSKIIRADYAAAVRRFGEGQRALLAALSAYNTGSFERGFENGYVSHYFASTAPASVIGATQPVVTPYDADPNVYTREAINVPVE